MLEKERLYKFDNIRFILIFSVVFGHFLELFLDDPIALVLYKIIYSFHMPVFIFLTGYFAKFNIKRVFSQLIVPFFIFQTLYLIFDFYVIKNSNRFTLQYMTPYWILWYLFATIVYYFFIPILKRGNVFFGWSVTVVSVAWALLSGFNDDFGYYLSLARIFTFLPFFIVGWYFGNTNLFDGIRSFVKNRKKICLFISALGMIASFGLILCFFRITPSMLYGSCSYLKANYTMWHRVVFMAVAVFSGVFLYIVVPEKRIFGVSTVGKNTYYIFILHGFLLRFIQETNLFSIMPYGKFSLALVLTVGILALFGNDLVYKICNLLFTGRGMVHMVKHTYSFIKEKINRKSRPN